MRETRLIMGMPITLEVLDESISADVLEKIFDYFHLVDYVFSTYKPESEINLINAGKKKPSQFSGEMKTIFELAEKTKDETNGYFDMYRNGLVDPSGIVKGWAIFEAAKKLKTWGFQHF